MIGCLGLSYKCETCYCRVSSRLFIPRGCNVLALLIRFPMGGDFSYRDIFARFKTMWRNQNLASALGISKKKIGGNHAFFRDNKASISPEYLEMHRVGTDLKINDNLFFLSFFLSSLRQRL